MRWNNKKRCGCGFNHFILVFISILTSSYLPHLTTSKYCLHNNYINNDAAHYKKWHQTNMNRIETKLYFADAVWLAALVMTDIMSRPEFSCRWWRPTLSVVCNVTEVCETCNCIFFFIFSSPLPPLSFFFFLKSHAVMMQLCLLRVMTHSSSSEGYFHLTSVLC